MSVPGAPRKTQRTSQASTVLAHPPCSDIDQQVYCISYLLNEEGIKNSDISYQQETFDMLVGLGIDPIWLPSEEALNVKKEDPHFYILPNFSGNVFEHLKSVKCKVIGTHLVRKCLEESSPIPKSSSPVFSFNFTGITVCFTGLTLERRKELTKLVRYMNGKVERNFKSSVTHLVTEKGSYDSEKYRAARIKRMPIMSPDWIEDGWKKSQKKDFITFNNLEIIENYLLPILNKMIICTSGINGQERTDLIRLIELHGGRSPGEMRRGECTHLVTENTVGEKYRKAKEWGDVKVVTMRWVRKSIELGYVQNEAKFDPAIAHPLVAKISTQIPGATGPRELDVSSIYGPLKHTINSQEYNATSRDKTTAPSPITPSSAMPRTMSKRNIQNENYGPESCLEKLINTTLKGDFDFFEDYTIFVAGIDKQLQEKINKILDRCGTTRTNSIERASHIIVGNLKETEKATLADAQRRGVYVLRPEWLVDCIEKKEHLNVDEYHWDPEATSVRSSFVNTSIVQQSNQQINYDANTSKPSVFHGISTVSNQLRIEPVDSISQECTVFSDLTFRIHNLKSDLEAQLRKMIEDCAGYVLEDDSYETIVDYLVAGQVEFGDVPDVHAKRYKNLVTENFVRHCIANKRLYDTQDRPLFRPLPAVSESKIFSGIVFGFVSLGDIDKFTFSHLVRDFGGTIEATIVIRPKNGIKPCTHIVAGEESAKLVEFRKKLSHLKIIDPSWIIDSIINDKRLIEVKYPFKNKAYDSYPGRSDDFWQKTKIIQSSTLNNTNNFEDPREIIYDSNLELNFDGPSDFQAGILKCKTSTPKAPPGKRRTSLDRFNPRLQLEGVNKALEDMPSPERAEEDSPSSLSITKIGKVLSEGAIKTGKTPIKEPQRAVTDPNYVSSNIVINKDDFYRITPKRSALTGKKEDKPQCSKKDTFEEVALSSRLMQRQIDYLAGLKKEPEETRCDETGTGRKRGHEMIKDSPTAPPAKRNNIILEPAVDWHSETSDKLNENDGEKLSTSKRTSIDESISKSVFTEAVSEEHSSQVISLDVPAVPEKRRSSRTSGNEQALAEGKQKSVVPAIEKSKSSRRSSKDATKSTKIFQSQKSTPKTKVFLFTGIAKEKEFFESIVLQLGGKIASDYPEVPSDVTHLICGKLIRGTKLMGCIASGRWVLIPEYLTESNLAGRFLEEDDYEWGNSTVISRNKLEGRDKQIAEACLRWRIKLAETKKKGAFTGWKILIYSTKEKSASLIPLMEAGDAQVIAREKLTTSISEYKPTHVFVIKSIEWNEREKQQVIACGSKVFQLEFLSSFLLDATFDEELGLHPDFRVYRAQQKIIG